MKRTKVLAAAMAVTLMLSGCMAEEVGVKFNPDSSGSAKVAVYFADDFIKEMGGTAEDMFAQSGDAEGELVTRKFNGVSYTGMSNELDFKRPKELVDTLNSKVSSDTGYDIDKTGGFQAEVSEQDGKDVLTFSLLATKEDSSTVIFAGDGVTSINGKPVVEGQPVELEGGFDASIDEETLQGVLVDLTLTFPGGVKSVEGLDKQLYTIKDNTFQMTVTADKLNKDISVVGILGDAGVVPRDNRADKFPETLKYDGRFNDVHSSAWYADALVRAYNIGVIAGTGPNTFTPEGILTRSQVIVMAARLHSIYTDDNASFTAANPGSWYQGFVEYAIANGIIQKDTFQNYDAPASRAEMAYVFAHALPDEMYDKGSNPDFEDVTASTPYYAEIMKLYNSGIVAGVGNNKYAPDATVTRGQAVVFVARLSDPANR